MSDALLSDVPIGQRVTVRRRSDDGRPTDTVGVVTARDEESITLETRQGPVRIVLSAVQVFRLVAPTPWRIANFLGRGQLVVLGIDTIVGPAAAASEVMALIDRLLTADTPVFILSDDGARASVALEQAGLGHAAALLLSPDTDQPGGDVLALAHARLQDHLGEVVPAGDVHFTAADPAVVDAARLLGWQARIFTPPS